MVAATVEKRLPERTSSAVMATPPGFPGARKCPVTVTGCGFPATSAPARASIASR